MKSPSPPKPPPVPPPVTASSADATAAATDAKRRAKSGYNWDKTIYRSGGLSALPPGTSATLGK